MVMGFPEDLSCAFCRFINGEESQHNTRGDVVHEDAATLAFVSPKWWPNNPGNVIVIPRRHFETIYDIPDDVLAQVFLAAKRLAIAMKTAYACDGVSLRQHNEVGGGQEVPHFHVHVLPRYFGDELYQRVDEHRFAPVQERAIYASKLKTALNIPVTPLPA
jgi:histidine triad (HIT) family protein